MIHSALPKVAIIGCGGTISTIAESELDYVNYVDTGRKVGVEEMLKRVPVVTRIADLQVINLPSVSSSAIGPSRWIRLRDLCRKLAAQNDLSGIVILHGTGTLEETAFFLHLTLTLDVPVVLVGAQRPLGTVSSDAPANLIGAVTTATVSKLHGVFVVMNGEIHSARHVQKSDTYSLAAFQSPGYGPVGRLTNDGPIISGQIVSKVRFGAWRGTEFPRVDVIPSYGGADDVMINACIAAGARGLISAGFAPGLSTPVQTMALEQASAAGIVVVQGSRTYRGEIVERGRFSENGFIAASDLSPWKARVLLSIALANRLSLREIRSAFNDA
jgi:L-asparaginase